MKPFSMMALAIAVLFCAAVCRADQKDDLYLKGQQAVNSGDSIGASNAFCALPYDYKDAGAQCATFRALAQKTIFRYRINYAEGMAALQAGDFSTAEIKFRNVKGGNLREQAKDRLAEAQQLKAQAAAEAQAHIAAVAKQQAKTELDQQQQIDERAAASRTMHISESGSAFQRACVQNTQFEEKAFAGRDMQSFFCAGWVRGLTDQVNARGTACVPSSVGVSQETALMINYVRQHSAEANEPAAALLEKALLEQYPCNTEASGAATR